MTQKVARVGGKNEADFFNPPNIPDSFKKAVGVVQVAMGRLGFLHRKIYNVLLANAYEGLGQGKKSFAIPVRTLAELSGFESNDFQMLYDHGLDLVRTEVEFIDFDSKTAGKGRGKRRRGATTLISDFVVAEGGIVTYSYSPEMAKKVYEPEQYVWMAISAQNRFSSKYELNLFENCIRYVAIGSTGFKDVSEWRTVLGAEDRTYDAFKDLNKKVLKPATKGVSEKSGILVEPEFEREKRKIARIKFSVRENPQMSLLDYKEHDRIRTTKAFVGAVRLGCSDAEAIHWIETQGEAYVSDAVAYVDSKKGVKNPTGYLMRALREGFGEKSPEERKCEQAALEKAAAIKAKREAAERAEAEAGEVQTAFNERRREKGRALIASLDAAAIAELRENAKGAVPRIGSMQRRLEEVDSDIEKLGDSPSDKLIAGYIATEALKNWGKREDWDIQAYCEREKIAPEVRAYIL